MTRGPEYQERLHPRFLIDAHGRIVIRDGRITLVYGSGRGFQEGAFTWDIHRFTWDIHGAEVPLPAAWLATASQPERR